MPPGNEFSISIVIFQPHIICCVLGALAVQLLQVIEASKLPTNRKPDYTSLEYYVTTLFSILIAGIVGYIYFDGTNAYGKIVYFHTGASAPLLIRTLATTLPAAMKPGK